MKLDTRIQVRTSRKLKQEATEALDRMGIPMPTAINMFLTQVVREQRLPFQPGALLYERALREAEAEPALAVSDLDEMMAIIDNA